MSQSKARLEPEIDTDNRVSVMADQHFSECKSYINVNHDKDYSQHVIDPEPSVKNVHPLSSTLKGLSMCRQLSSLIEEKIQLLISC